jgi:hypothetical protein
MLMIWSSRARNRQNPSSHASSAASSSRPTRPQNHAHRFDEIFKTKLQGSGVSSAKTLQSQNRQRAEIRLSLNGLQVVQRATIESSLTTVSIERRTPEMAIQQLE